MKKFVFLYYRNENPSKELSDATMKWFGSIGEKLVDSGNPFGPGREVTKEGTKTLPLDNEAIIGYSILNADNMEQAEEIAKSCPVGVVRVYEAMPM